MSLKSVLSQSRKKNEEFRKKKVCEMPSQNSVIMEKLV